MNGFSNNNQPITKGSEEQLKISTGEGESPLASPPPPKVDIRTMESDLKSLQESGGQTVQPYTPSPQPQEPVFQPPQVETTSPIPPKSTPSSTSPIPEPEKKKGNKNLLMILIIALIIIAAGAAGYFFVYPALFPQTTQEKFVPPSPSQPEEVPPVEIPPAEIPPTETPPTEGPKTPSEEQPTTEETNTAAVNQLPTISTYSFYFQTPPSASQEIVLTAPSVEALRQLIPFVTSSEASFKELVIKNPAGQVISFKGLMPLLVPKFFDPATLNYFEDNYNVFAYTDKDGTWLGFVAKLKNGVDVPAIQNRMAALQNDPDNRNFFLIDVGEMGVWRDGLIKNKPSSLVDFAQPGATLSYTWFENFLLLSTNLNGATEAATRLGF